MPGHSEDLCTLAITNEEGPVFAAHGASGPIALFVGQICPMLACKKQDGRR